MAVRSAMFDTQKPSTAWVAQRCSLGYRDRLRGSRHGRVLTSAVMMGFSGLQEEDQEDSDRVRVESVINPAEISMCRSVQHNAWCRYGAITAHNVVPGVNIACGTGLYDGLRTDSAGPSCGSEYRQDTDIAHDGNS
eukprot:2749195-Rhodomonas_salina.2